VSAVRIALELLLDQQRQAVEALTHVRVAGRKPNPRAAREPDHRRRLPFASAFISADTVEASTDPEIRIRPPVANSISMMPALSGGGQDTAAGSGSNNAGICVRSQSC